MRLVQTGVAVVLSVALIVSMAAPAVAQSEETLTIDVEQGDGVTVTVAQNGTAVENATVTVEAVNNTTYAGVGTETTDENGTVSLPTPDENVTVELAAAAGNATATKTVTLLSDADETEDGEETEEGEEGAPLTFGERVSAFVHGMLNAGEEDGSLGRLVSEFVTANNPGADQRSDRASENHGNASSDADTKRPGQAGEQSNTSEDAGSATNGHGKSDEKRPEHAKNKSSKENGPKDKGPKDKGPKDKGPKDDGDDGDDYEAQPDDADEADEDGDDGESETQSGDDKQNGKQKGER